MRNDVKKKEKKKDWSMGSEKLDYIRIKGLNTGLSPVSIKTGLLGGLGRFASFSSVALMYSSLTT